MGCSIAVLAMIAEMPYAEVRAGFPKVPAGAYELWRWLRDRGWSVECIYFRQSGYDKRAEMIPADGDYYLWVSVGSNTWRHSLLQLKDGTILDPEKPGAFRLEDYPEVQDVVLVQPIWQAMAHK